LQEQATSKVSDQGREFSTPRSIVAGVQLPEEVERALTEVGNQFGLVPTCLVGGVFSVLGAAVGNGAILETSFFPAPVNSSLHCLLFDKEGNAAERSVQALIQPLRDIQDQKLTTLMQAGAKNVHEQIHRVERERESFFGANAVRDPAVEASFEAKITQLRSLLHPVIISENCLPGNLYQAAAKGDGRGLLAVYGDLAFGQLLGAKKRAADLDVLSRGWLGKTPENGALDTTKSQLLIRPAIGCVLICSSGTIARLVCSGEATTREFVDRLILSDAARMMRSGSAVTADGRRQLPERWSTLIQRLVRLRESGAQRRVRLSSQAVDLLAEYVREVDQSGQERWLKHAPTIAAKLAVILHFCGAGTMTEIVENTMRNAVVLARWLIKETAATASQCAAREQENSVREEATRMLQKLRSLMSLGKRIRPREVYRKYNDPKKALHEPALDLLLRTGQARCLEDGTLELVPQAPGGPA